MGEASNKRTIIGEAVPNIPWEDRPEGYDKVVWRSKRNPIIPRDLIPTSNSIFNSAVVPYEGKFAGVFRCDDTARRMVLHSGHSEDGINWQIDEEPMTSSSVDEAVETFNERIVEHLKQS